MRDARGGVRRLALRKERGKQRKNRTAKLLLILIPGEAPLHLLPPLLRDLRAWQMLRNTDILKFKPIQHAQACRVFRVGLCQKLPQPHLAECRVQAFGAADQCFIDSKRRRIRPGICMLPPERELHLAGLDLLADLLPEFFGKFRQCLRLSGRSKEEKHTGSGGGTIPTGRLKQDTHRMHRLLAGLRVQQQVCKAEPAAGKDAVYVQPGLLDVCTQRGGVRALVSGAEGIVPEAGSQQVCLRLHLRQWRRLLQCNIE